MNVVVLVGRTTADCDLRYTGSGVAVASFTLAVDRKYAKEGQQKTDFVNIVAWNKLGELCANYLQKGKLAGVTGELHIRSYEKDGQKRWVTEVTADQVKFLSPKDGGNFLGREVTVDDDSIPF